MARNSQIGQVELIVELIVDGDGPIAVFFRKGKGYRRTRRYRCPVYASKERKQRFIQRVAAAQMALCRDIEEVEHETV